MLSPSDLSAFLDRVGYDGPIEASRHALGRLQLRHLLTIPFETLDSVAGRSPPLDPPRIMDKLVRKRRGGYCFEHNLLFKAVLECFGFQPEGLLGRVFLGEPEDAEPPRTHMLLRVPIDGETFLVDVGFGGQVLTGPIRLLAGAVQDTPHEPYRLDLDAGTWSLRACVGEEWKLLYRFTTEQTLPIDYDVANHYVATHPKSFFARAVVGALILPHGRLTLLNLRLTEHRLGGPSRSEDLPDENTLRQVLAQRFGIEADDALWQAVVHGLRRST